VTLAVALSCSKHCCMKRSFCGGVAGLVRLLGAALLELDLAALAAGCMMPGECEVGAAVSCSCSVTSVVALSCRLRASNFNL
jgi:hypothetical protein